MLFLSHLQDITPAPVASTELAAAAFQALLTALLAVLCLGVWRRGREAHYGWWAAAFALYTLRIGAIITFLATSDRAWLFWHQVITGWTALTLLWAAIVFARQARWRPAYATLIAFPLVWSYIAVHKLESFALAAGPMVVFISAATLGTGVVLLRNRSEGTRQATTLLGWTFIIWGLHHLDYPLLRARGAWLPWGYYLDILFVLAVGTGILLLVNSQLAVRLQARSAELERLSRRMVHHHEEERRRLSMALHDETAQIFAAVKLQLGIVREEVAPATGERLDRAIASFDDGIRVVRNVTRDLRPSLLDDLGLLAALRSLVAEFGEKHNLRVAFHAPDVLPVMSGDVEVAAYRAVQEALTNVSRHARGATAAARISVTGDELYIRIEDDGPGLSGSDSLARAERDGHLGIAGMRERIGALGGDVRVESGPGGGVRLSVRIPIVEEDQP